MSELYSKRSDKEQSIQREYIRYRLDQLYDMQVKWSDICHKYFFLVNSGGAVATLGFLGAFQNFAQAAYAKWSLLFFIIGITLIGLFNLMQHRAVSKALNGWAKDYAHFLEDKITWETLNEADFKRSVNSFLDYAVPISSFFCFIAGCCFGAMALFGD